MVYWYDFVYSPAGFYGKDIAIDAISAVVVLMIGLFCVRNFLLDNKNKKHLVISSAFFLLGASFVVKTLTNIIIHTKSVNDQDVIFGLSFGYHLISAVGFLIHAFLTLFGFYIIYALTSKDELTMNYVIIAYFIVISTYFARFNYYLFYVTTLLFLVAITRRYFIQYKKYKYKNTMFLGISFAVISLSNFFFIFTGTNRTLYVLAEIVQLVGYCFLLYTFVMVLKNARKKN